MDVLISLVLGFLYYIVGIFAFSQIFGSLLLAIPTAIAMKRERLMDFNCPAEKNAILTTVIWCLITAGIIAFAYYVLHKYLTMIIIGLVISAVMSLTTARGTNNRRDFFETYRDYINFR